MRVRFWGTRGSLPVAAKAAAVRQKVAQALVLANGRRFSSEAEALAFVDGDLDFAAGSTYGGATSCVEIEGGDGSFIVCDMGSGLREFGLSAAARCSAGHKREYHFFLSHLHWDHIMGFPFFVAAFDPEAIITVHSGHADAETALRRQQEEISFPVPFDWLKAQFRFITLEPGATYDCAGLKVEVIRQYHAHDSYGFRFVDGERTVIYSTDSEHRLGDMEQEARFAAFFAGADVAICDTMYSLADSVTMKEDWGHSSNLVAVDLCHAAAAKRLVLFHHEPAYSDEDIQRMHDETIRYEELMREDRRPLEIICAYDGLELDV
jgi:phosphoribosyl 1,2-cyclic phosphodiesterase